MSPGPAAGAARIPAGGVRALARAISLVESRDPSVRDILAGYGQVRIPYTLGFTGPPGAGKSTLVDALIARLRRDGKTVAVIAVDPSSPFTGGALLGDRVRMNRHALDPGVYIRSMGARGHLGGLSVATREAARVMGAFGFDHLLLETVGVGQSELEVASVADTTLVILNPSQGDGVQMIKAGILEIADLFVVNKADLPGATRTVMELRAMLNMNGKMAWKPPIVSTVAAREEGLDEMLAAVERHRAHLQDSGQGAARTALRLRQEVAELAAERARERALRHLDRDPDLSARLVEGLLPHAVVDALLGPEPAPTVTGSWPAAAQPT